MPRVRVNLRDLDDAEEFDSQEDWQEQAGVESEPRKRDETRPKSMNAQALERKAEGRRRGREITRHLREITKRGGKPMS